MAAPVFFADVRTALAFPIPRLGTNRARNHHDAGRAPGALRFGSVVFDVHTILVAMAAILVGSQTITFFLLAKRFAINERLLPDDSKFRAFRNLVSLERAVAAGLAMIAVGVDDKSFPPLQPRPSKIRAVSFGLRP